MGINVTVTAYTNEKHLIFLSNIVSTLFLYVNYYSQVNTCKHNHYCHNRNILIPKTNAFTAKL